MHFILLPGALIYTFKDFILLIPGIKMAFLTSKEELLLHHKLKTILP